MKFQFAKLSQKEALEIASWKYQGIYEFYNMDYIPEDLKEFIDQEKRNKAISDYYSTKNEQGELIGFIELANKHNECLIGLGLKPTFTGKGIGISFINSILIFIKEIYPNVTLLRMSVVDFNERAIIVYKRAGFKEAGSYTSIINQKEYHFITLNKEI